MKRFPVTGVLLLTALGAFLLSQSCSAAKHRAVSLRALESTLKAGSSKQAESLCGITRVSGFVMDNKSNDIVLFGEVSPDYPPLHLEDFVIALRNVELVYAKREGHTLYYAAPGCSIDPDPNVLRDLQLLNENGMTASDSEARDQYLERWRSIGSRPQNVRVLGIPFYTRFAKIMVDADYYMKRLANGSVDLDIAGFENLMDVRMDISLRQLQSGEEDTSPGASMSRFWFCPGDTTFSDEGDALLLKTCRVKLLTEEQFLTESGTIAGYGRPDPLAQDFAGSFTSRYAEIAAARPIYKELEGLFRFVGIARLMKDEDAFSKSGFKPSHLISKYPVKNVAVSPQVLGLTNIKEHNERKDTEDGYTTTYLCHMSCGGVSMDVQPKRVSAPKRKTSSASATRSGAGVSRSQTSTTKKTILDSKKSANSLYWDVPEME